MTEERKEVEERIIDKVRETLIDLMDHDDPAIQLEAVKAALTVMDIKKALVEGEE